MSKAGIEKTERKKKKERKKGTDAKLIKLEKPSTSFPRVLSFYMKPKYKGV